MMRNERKERLTTNKSVSEMGMYELAHRSRKKIKGSDEGGINRMKKITERIEHKDFDNEDMCIILATHAIGLDSKKPYKRHGRYFFKPYRNYYDASMKDCEVWDVMLSKGYAKAGRKNRYGGRMYWLTRKGLDWLGEKLKIYIHDEDD